MSPRLPHAAAALSVAALALAGLPAPAAAEIPSSTSSNWSGYGITGLPTRPATRFTHVAGVWAQPTATCTQGRRAYSAFWVGLGGMDSSSPSLEQIGTEVDCSASGHAVYSAWYELLPAGPKTIGMRVAAGDLVSGHVSVRGRIVTLRLADLNTGKSFSKRIRMRSPDLSSAEWIAEAPAACDGADFCRPLALADFGTVSFSSAAAIANGHAGVISDPAWSATAISLTGSGTRFGHRRFLADAASSTATPSPLSPTAAFAITWQQAPAAATPADQSGPPGGGIPTGGSLNS